MFGLWRWRCQGGRKRKPLRVVIEFGEEDVVVCSGGGFDPVIKPPTDIEIEIPMG